MRKTTYKELDTIGYFEVLRVRAAACDTRNRVVFQFNEKNWICVLHVDKEEYFVLRDVDACQDDDNDPHLLLMIGSVDSYERIDGIDQVVHTKFIVSRLEHGIFKDLIKIMCDQIIVDFAQ